MEPVMSELRGWRCEGCGRRVWLHAQSWQTIAGRLFHWTCGMSFELGKRDGIESERAACRYRVLRAGVTSEIQARVIEDLIMNGGAE